MMEGRAEDKRGMSNGLSLRQCALEPEPEPELELEPEPGLVLVLVLGPELEPEHVQPEGTNDDDSRPSGRSGWEIQTMQVPTLLQP